MLFVWCTKIEASTPPYGPPLSPFPPRSVAYPKPSSWRVLFCPGGARPPTQVLRAFVDKHRDVYGVEPICKVLQIAQSGYRCHAARQRKPELLCTRAKRDHALMPQIQAVWQANMQVYRADKVWHQMNREGTKMARSTVERLMRRLGLHGVRRGKVVRTTVPDKAAPCPLDRVNRQFKADRPNQLWVSDFTYVSTWQGWQYVAFVIDVFARRIVGWRVSSSMHTDFVLDALEQALFDRQPERSDGRRPPAQRCRWRNQAIGRPVRAQPVPGGGRAFLAPRESSEYL